jgi:adenylate cyclase
MDEAGNLSLENRPSDFARSRIREINMMNVSLNKMKIGLKSFSKYVPIELVKKLLQTTHAPELGGEKKEITILFADLAQFTFLSESLPPQELASILKDFLTAISDEVHREKGIIDKFIGDAAMALWGAPEALSDHPLAACRAAIAFNKMASLHPRMKYKMGINSGNALIGNFGSEKRMDYTAIGDTVNIASRLEKLNKVYGTEILIGEETAKKVAEVFLIRPVDWVVLRGRTKSHLIYELIGIKQEATQEQLLGVQIYQHALNAYQHQKFGEAIVLFEKANILFGEKDGPALILAQRCRLYEQNPPSENWNYT